MSESKATTPLIPPSSSRALPDFKQSVKIEVCEAWLPLPHYSWNLPMLVPSSNCHCSSIIHFLSKISISYSNLISAVLCSTLLVFLSTVYVLTRPRPVYLVNFSCYKPDDDRKCTRQIFVERSKLTGTFTEEYLNFQRKILERFGRGESTYLREAVLRVPPNPCMAEARKEAETVMFGAIDELLAKTSLKPKDVWILIVNCSVFDPTPSLSAMVINHYKMRAIRQLQSRWNGCSAD